MNIHRNFTPNKPCEYGSSAAAVRSVISAAGGPKMVAERLGRRLSAVYSYSDPDAAHPISFDAVRKLTTPTSRAAAEDLAALAGCALVPIDRSPRKLSDLVADGVREQAQFVAAYVGSVPNALTAIERLVLLQEADDAIRAWGEIRAALVAE